MVDRPPALAPFQHGIFRSVWIASLGSNFGSQFQTVGAAWMMTAISSSADMVALVQASNTLPIMLFSMIAGAIADSFDRRRVMLVAQSSMFVVSVALTVVTYAGLITPWLLLTFTFLIGCGTALNNPSWQASVGDMVPRAHVPAAVVLNSMGFNITRSVGPALGGIIVATVGAAAAFAINAVSYIGLIAVIFRWKRPPPTDTIPRETLGPAIVAGIRYVAMSPNIGKVLLRAFVFGFASVAAIALLPLVARDMLEGGALLYGILYGAFGVGAIGGGMLNGPLRERLASEWIVRLAFASFAISLLLIATVPFAFVTCIALLVSGTCWVMALALFNVTVQLSTPRWVVGRALSIYQMFAFGGMALGSWTWGIIAETDGPQTALVVAGGCMVLGAAMGLGGLALPPQSSLNLDPLNRWKEPLRRLDLTPRSGPIKITIEYVVREENARAFLTAMAERKRVRRRNGARRWTLTRDIENPEHWIESYHLPTWLDYVRHNQRTTHADFEISERIRQLHSGAEPPVVRRMIERTAGHYPSGEQPKDVIDLH